MITYARRQFYTKTRHSITRSLPRGAQILVRVGEEVKPEKIIGVGRKPAGYRTIEAAEILNVAPQKLGKMLVKTLGSQVEKGEIIVKKPGIFGIGSNELESPSRGILRSVDEKTGSVVIEYLPEEIKSVAGVQGIVKTISAEDASVTLETLASEVQGFTGMGEEREGTIKVVGNPDLPLSDSLVDPSWENKIIAGGSFISKKVLYHCLAVQARGIIVGGMNWSDYSALLGSRGKLEDIGISVIVLEGFGNMPIPQKLFEQIGKLDGKFAFIHGSDSRMLVPHSTQQATEQEQTSVTSFYSRAKEGLHVKLRLLEKRGEFGTITKLYDDMISFESGVSSQAVELELRDGSTLKVPVTSVEIIKN